MDAVKVKKGVIFTVRACYRSVCKHPFFVGMVIFLIFMYRSFPLLFSFLVSASPVIVSTAVLLGTLLSFGQPNIPEIEKEEISHEIASLQTGGGLDHSVVERDGSYMVERYSESRSDDKSSEVGLIANDFSDVGKNDGLAESAPLIKENSREFQFEKWETHGESDSCDVVFGHKNEVREGDGEVPVNVYTPVQRTVDEFENAKLFEAYVGAETVDRLSPPGSPRKHEDENEEHEYDDDDDDLSESESDGDESSSPDASMADIIPLLDELHPLLDEDVPQRARMPLDESDGTSESSSESSSDEDNEVDDDIENHENELEVVDDEEEQEGHEDKSAIRWTEVDQKNLMDLGTSELERNKRLESLIARRRLRKSMKMMTEKNLIDFDGVDLPFSISHISTARRNPFDLPYDDDMGLPPIPGSAPSIMSQRRNPFDLPYDSSEEKPDLMGDDFQQDAMTLQPKEPVFRRNETFNVGPSLFGTSRHESKFRPYFIPERMTFEGTSYASFHRQSSDLSESKASSVPETESITSDEDLEDKKPVEEDLEHGKSIEEDSEHGKAIVEDLEHGKAIEEELEHKKEFEEDLVNLTELISIAEPELSSIPEHPSEHVGHGSDSSEDEDSLYPDQEKREGVKDEYEATVERNTNEVHLNTEALKLKSRSSSSISEVNAENEDELLLISEPLRGNSSEDFTMLHQPSMENSDTEVVRKLVDDTQHKEPVYDLSPRALDKEISSSSVDSDLRVEEGKDSSSPSLVPRKISFTQQDCEVNNKEIDSNPGHEVDEELVVTQHQPPSEEHMARSEIGLPLSDQSVNEPSPRNPEGPQESTNLIDLDFQGLDNIYQDIDPPKTFESTSMVPKATEIGALEAGLNDDTLERVGSDEKVHFVEQHMFPVEADTPTTTGNMEDNVEDLEDIEEIHEGLLHELDTVGDFSIQEFRSDLNECGEQRFHMMHNIGSSEDLENNNDYSGVTLGDVNFRAFAAGKEPSNSEEEIEKASTFLISETSLGEHLNSSNRQMVQVEAPDLLDFEKTNDRPLLEETATELADLNIMLNPNAREMSSGLPIVEVQAIHDSEFSYKEAEPMLEEMYVGFREPEILHQDSFHVKTEVGMPVLEARSLDDIRSALDQLDANASEKQYDVDRLDSENTKPLQEETATKLSDSNIMQISDVGEVNSGIMAVEVQAIFDNEFSYKEAEPMPENMSVQFGESVILPQDPLHANIVVGMPVLEAHSLDDIRSALAQVDAKESEKQYAVDLVSTELSPRENLDGYSPREMVHEGSVLPDSKSNFTLLESNLVDVEKSALELQKDLLHAETEVVIPVLESRPLDDFESDIDQVDGIDSEKQYAPNSVNVKLSPDETVGECSQHEMLHDGLVPQESNSDITVMESKLVQDDQTAQQHGESVDRIIPRGSDGDDMDSAKSYDPVENLSSAHVDEARSIDDINATPVYISAANIEKLPIANSEIEPVEPAVDEVRSSKAIESSSEVSGVVETNAENAEKVPKGETTIDSKIPVVEHKKSESRKSSSSSSSSSSDSDRE